eukprot:9954258-Alexandrium_andersonii.AAC.1
MQMPSALTEDCAGCNFYSATSLLGKYGEQACVVGLPSVAPPVPPPLRHPSALRPPSTGARSC